MSLLPTKKISELVVESDKIVEELCNLICHLSQKAIQESGCFNIGLSGGSAAKYVCQGLPSIETDWAKWKLYFCDERLVPIDHEESTLKIYVEGLIGTTPLKKNQIIAVDTSLDVTAAAADYESKIREEFPHCDWPSFDLLLLGMGPDGHTASLFPGHPLLSESQAWVAPIADSPKPPPQRVTMTLPLINSAKAVVFVVAGQAKAPMVKRILFDREDLPCTRVQPVGELVWMMDKSAASLIPR